MTDHLPFSFFPKPSDEQQQTTTAAVEEEEEENDWLLAFLNKNALSPSLSPEGASLSLSLFINE